MSDARKARDHDLLDKLDSFERITFEGNVWRVVRRSRDVLQASPVGARWDPGQFDVLYTSLKPDTALEEIYFHLTRQPVFPSTIEFQIHRINLRIHDLLQLDSAELQELGVDMASFGQMDYSRTQAIADGAFFLGFSGLIIPSARAKANNLVIFTDRIEPEDIEVQESKIINWKEWQALRK